MNVLKVEKYQSLKQLTGKSIEKGHIRKLSNNKASATF